jgi:hypothetical protein
MINVTNLWIVPWLVFLTDWSVRWGLVLAALALWFAVRPPRRAATRHAVCAAGLVAGLLLPVVPRWGSAAIVWPAARARSPLTPSSRQGAGSEVLTGRTAEASTPSRLGERSASPSGPSRRVPAAEPPGASSRWAVALGTGAWQLSVWVLAATWVVMVVILSARLLGGWLWLAGLRRGARAVGATSRSLLDECREVLRLSRRPDLVAHPVVASPVTVGGLRPLVLVPLDWDEWPESHRRACLLHELAHLHRRDDWAKLVQELVRIPFFFHPLIRWLLARLDRERELLCDEAVVVLGADPVAYARLLLDLARRPARLVPGGASFEPPWLPFLDRGTVAERIERLMDDDMLRALTPLSSRRLFALGALALATTLGAGSLRVRAVESQESRPGKTQRATSKAEHAGPFSRTIKGRVVDPEGKPVSGVVVVVGIRDAGAPNHRVLATDKEGRFSWQLPPGPLALSCLAHKPGWGAIVNDRWLDTKQPGDDLVMKLGKPEPFTAVLIDQEGKPVAGARVRIEMSAQSGSNPEEGGRRSTWTAYSYYPHDVLAGSPLEPQFVTKTDDRGSFSFHSVPAGHQLRLAVTTRDGREMRVKAPTRADGSRDSKMTGEGFVSVPPGQVARLAIFPAARVQGRVTTRLPGVSVSGIRVWYKGSPVRQGRASTPANFTGIVRTDAEGRFVFDGLEEGPINIWVMEDHATVPWTYRAAGPIQLRSGWTKSALIELIGGVEIKGKVIVQGTGEPVKGVRIGVKGPLSPWGEAMDTSGTTDAEGRYRYRLPPGETSFYLLDDPPAFARVSDKESTRTVTIPDAVARFEVPPIVVARRAHRPGP